MSVPTFKSNKPYDTIMGSATLKYQQGNAFFDALGNFVKDAEGMTAEIRDDSIIARVREKFEPPAKVGDAALLTQRFEEEHRKMLKEDRAALYAERLAG